jgi:hypothetical protein
MIGRTRIHLLNLSTNGGLLSLINHSRLSTDHLPRLIPFTNNSNRVTPCPPTSPPGRSLWLRLLHVIEQREDHILRVNSLIRLLGSHGFLTDQYLLGPPIRFGEVNPSDTVVYRSAIHTRQGFGVLVIDGHPLPIPMPSAKAWERVSAYTNDEFVSFFHWRTLIKAKLLDCLIPHLRHLEYEIAKSYLPR